MTVPELHREHIDEYRLLSDEEKAELVKWYTEERSRKKVRRATPRARVQDVSNTVRNMQMLVCVHAYFCYSAKDFLSSRPSPIV
jgi:succinate dehydrogenase flavin-adding protein (antitoxin of CptAB toxin-antitoxin module)